jgi:dipicolinate synthase subunit A
MVLRPNLKGTSIAVLGGDAREVFLATELAMSGATVKVAYLPVKGDTVGIIPCRKPEESLKNVQAVILPVPGINEKGYLYCPLSGEHVDFSHALAPVIPQNTPVFVGTARNLLKETARSNKFHLIELMKLNEVAILNSIPTAEGAVQIAMEMLPVTIHGSSAYVLGFGRTGMTLARLLGLMGARTRVIARRPEHLARIEAMGLLPIPFLHMADYLDEAEVIFNTIPAQVLTGEILKKISSNAVIIDLASAPGGTDFQTAESLKIKAVLAPGLPGKVSPKTAGLILVRVITRLLLDEVLN